MYKLAYLRMLDIDTSTPTNFRITIKGFGYKNLLRYPKPPSLAVKDVGDEFSPERFLFSNLLVILRSSLARLSFFLFN